MIILKNKDRYEEAYFEIVDIVNALKEYDVRPKYFSLDNEMIIKQFMNSLPEKCLAYLGSGDFHYLTYFLIKRLNIRPFVILFDNHFDMNKAPKGFITCGSWARQCIDENLVSGILVIGANKKYYFNDMRYPFMYYIEDGNKSINTKFMRKIKGKDFYISVDKDVLSEKYVKTNWDQGNMELANLLNKLKLFNRLGKVSGVDICGDIANNPIENFIHPEFRKAHEEVNHKIFEIFLN